MNPASYLYIVILLFILLVDSKHRFLNLFLFTLVCELYIEIGFLFSIGETLVRYSVMAELFLFVYVLFKILRERLCKLSLFRILLILIPVISLISILLYPSSEIGGTISITWDDYFLNGIPLQHPTINKYVLQTTIQFLMTAIIVLYAYRKINLNCFIYLFERFVKIVKFFIVLGVIELVIKYLLDDVFIWSESLAWFCGLTDSTSDGRLRGNGVELTLFTKEASHYAYVLMVSVIVLLSYNVSRKKMLFDKWLIMSFILMMFCMSFSVLLFGSFIVFLVFSYRWYVAKQSRMMKTERYLIILLLPFVLLFFLTTIIGINSDDGFFSRRLLNLFEEMNVIINGNWEISNVSSDWSHRIRLVSVLMTLKSVIYRPVFGYGLGTLYCHGSTAMLLSGIGVVGTYLWVRFMFFTGYIKRNIHIHRKIYMSAVILFLFVNTFSSLFLRPFYELPFVMISYSFCLLYETEKN